MDKRFFITIPILSSATDFYPLLRQPVSIIMTDPESNQLLELRDLEVKLDQLIAQYNATKNENHSLKTKQDELVKEKAHLLEKTKLARTRVEAMIARLKAMEHGS